MLENGTAEIPLVSFRHQICVSHCIPRSVRQATTTLPSQARPLVLPMVPASVN